MKCAICGEKIETTYLGKILGTYVRVKGKLYPVCRNCQKELGMEEIKKRLS